jgi:hypothetical protein
MIYQLALVVNYRAFDVAVLGVSQTETHGQRPSVTAAT